MSGAEQPTAPAPALPERQARLLPATWRRPVLGVLGGMGTAATVTFMDALTRATPAATDQDHIDSVVLNHAATPDRTARLRDLSRPDPTPYLQGDLALLGRLGADLAVIVCNTAHAFLGEDLPVRLLSIIEVGAQAAVDRATGAPADGAPADDAAAGDGEPPVVTVLATDGTLASGLYQDALARRGARVQVPPPADQARVMSVIYDKVKAGVPVPPADFAALVDELREGAGAVLLGCTELSVLYDEALVAQRPLPSYVVDAQAELVTRVLDEIGPGAG